MKDLREGCRACELTEGCVARHQDSETDGIGGTTRNLKLCLHKRSQRHNDHHHHRVVML